MATASEQVLLSEGYDELQERILALLDWRSLLSVALVNQHLNNVVRTSSRLQLQLRQAFYGVDHEFYTFKGQPAATSIDQMIATQRRWSTVAFETICRMPARPPQHYIPTQGLLVSYTKPRRKLAHLPYSQRSQPPTGWVIQDLCGSYACQASQRKVTAPTAFSILDARREDNIVAVGRLETNWIDGSAGSRNCLLKVQFFELENSAWANGTIDAVPHAMTKDLIDSVVISAGDNPRMRLRLRLGPGGTIMTQLISDTRLWDWRTGKLVLGCKGAGDKEQFSPVLDGLIGVGLREKTEPFGPHTLTYFSPSTGKHRELMPEFPRRFGLYRYNASCDPNGRVLAVDILSFEPEEGAIETWSGIWRFDRLRRSWAAPVEAPDPDETDVHLDSHLGMGDLWSAVCGYRVIYLRRLGESAFHLHVVDTRFTPVASYFDREDGLRSGPFGAKRAAGPERAPLSRRVRTVGYPYLYGLPTPDIWISRGYDSTRPKEVGEVDQEWQSGIFATCKAHPTASAMLSFRESREICWLGADPERIFLLTAKDDEGDRVTNDLYIINFAPREPSAKTRQGRGADKHQCPP